MERREGWNPPCTGCMRLLVSRYIMCQFVVIPRWQHSAVCSVWSWVCVWMWVHLCDSSLSYCLQSGACRSSPMGTPLLIGRRDQCSWMFVWVYICIVVGSFLVSVFSSLLFLCFFFDKGGLIVFITTTSIFWKELHKLMGRKLFMSTAFHPQTDGAMERANRSIAHTTHYSIKWPERLVGQMSDGGICHQ